MERRTAQHQQQYVIYELITVLSWTIRIHPIIHHWIGSIVYHFQAAEQIHCKKTQCALQKRSFWHPYFGHILFGILPHS